MIFKLCVHGFSSIVYSHVNLDKIDFSADFISTWYEFIMLSLFCLFYFV